MRPLQSQANILMQGPALALNIWYNSEPYLLMEEAFLAPLPFESSWPTNKLVSHADLSEPHDVHYDCGRPWPHSCTSRC